MNENLRAENRMLKEQLEIILNENEKLKEALETKFYCQYANKCNELYDCTREEYETMTLSNMKLSLENQELKEKIESVDEFCDRYMGCNLELFDMYGLLNKIREILGDKE